MMTYAWSYSPGHMGQVDDGKLKWTWAGGVGGEASTRADVAEREIVMKARKVDGKGDGEILTRFVGELERVMVLVAEGEKEEGVRARL